MFKKANLEIYEIDVDDIITESLGEHPGDEIGEDDLF